MRSLGILLILLTAAGNLFGQSTDPDKGFEQNKTKYIREHFVSGEDASSGYDYLFYKSRNKIVKIRSIWSASYTNELRIEDLYFNGELLILLQRLIGSKNQLAALKRGRSVPLTKKEELQFINSQLTNWKENGKVIAKSDLRWTETEKSTLENAKAERESYSWLKDSNE